MEILHQSLAHDFYANHHSWLNKWLSKKLGSTLDAADLAQDTFVSLLSNSNHEHINEPRAYLTTIAKRILSNFYKRQSLEQAYLEALANFPENIVLATEDRLILLENLQQINNMLENLPNKVRRAFLLSQLDGLSYAEIASQLQVNGRTVKRYMAKAFEQCLICIE